MTTSYEPITCTTEAVSGPSGGLTLSDLKERSLSVRSIDGGVAMTFKKGLLDELRQYAAQEAACCSWMTMEITPSGDEVLLEVTSDNPDAPSIIRGVAGVGQP